MATPHFRSLMLFVAAYAVMVLAVAACGERKAREVILDPTVVAMGGGNASIPQIELTIIAEINNRTPTPEPKPTSLAFWERPGAEKTAVASCPEGTSFSSIVIPSANSRLTVGEFVVRYPHGLVTCLGPPPSSGFLSNMPGFTILTITPEPRGVYFSDLVPTVTPTPKPKR